MSCVLVTTDYLVPGDEVDTLLRHHRHRRRAGRPMAA